MVRPQWLDMEWEPPPGVRAAFTLRTVGASVGPYHAFNTATHVGDAPDAVRLNRAALRASLRLEREPQWLDQVHGKAVCDLDRHTAAADAPLPTADAAVASQAQRVCVVQVADCLPILLATRDGTRVAAAHAGWRGLAAGVIEATVAALAVPGRMLTAWIGPGISTAHFEVGDEVRQAFLACTEEAGAAFHANARGRWQCDLVMLARQRLAALGIVQISGGRWCTFADAERFYSHRRAAPTGRMAALVWRV